MLELAQAAVGAAKQSSITVAVPTGVISSVATLMLYKGVPFLISTMRGKKNGNGHGSKPGEGQACKQHGEDIAVLNEFKNDTKKALETIGTDIKTLLGRVPAK